MTKEQYLEAYKAWVEIEENRETLSKEKDSEKLRKAFLKKFPLAKLKSLTLDEYVYGKSEDTFCYWVETKLKSLGSITGILRRSAKFGICYSKEDGKYLTMNRENRSSRFGATNEEVFQNVMAEIQRIAADPSNYDLLAQTPLNWLFANKIAYLYSDNCQIPVYSDRHLNVFLSVLEIPFSIFDNRAQKRKKLYEYYQELDCTGMTPYSFMQFLYHGAGLDRLLKYGYSKEKRRVASLNLTEANTQEKEAESNAPKKTEKHGLIDSDLSPEEKKYIGNLGEAAVKEYLLKHKKELGIVGDIDCRCENDDSAHYDFSYQREDGKTIYVEVKATKMNDPDKIHFFMSKPEYEFFMKHEEDYQIYYVNDVYGAKTVRHLRIPPDELFPSTYRAEFSQTDIEELKP